MRDVDRLMILAMHLNSVADELRWKVPMEGDVGVLVTELLKGTGELIFALRGME